MKIVVIASVKSGKNEYFGIKMSKEGYFVNKHFFKISFIGYLTVWNNY